MIAKSGNMEQKYEPLLLSQDFNGKFRDSNRQDEEHQMIFQHTETLRKHQRNKLLTMNNTLPGALQTQKSMDSAMEHVHTLPQLKNVPNTHYSVSQSQSSSGFKRYPFETENVNQVNLSSSVVSSSDDLRVRTSNSSLNQVIHGLENQKRQLMAEYERLQMQTPTNNINPAMSPILTTDNSSRYPPVDFGFAQCNRSLSYNQSIPPISSRKINRPLAPMSPNTTSLDRSGTYLLPSEDLVTEARMLRKHKGRLEARMGMLEQHNRQLEAQLSRLRQLIDESPSNPNHFMPSSNIVNSFLPNAINMDQDPEMLTAAQYAASKRINEINSMSPIYNNSPRFQGNYGIESLSRNYQNPSNIYSGTRSTPVQNFYGSLERGSSYRSIYDTTPVGNQYRSPVERQPQPVLSSANYLSNHQLKASSESGGSLSESEFQLMCRSLADSCPAVTSAPVHGQSTNSIGSLFHMAGQVGKAVGQLVNVMTDDLNNNQDRDSPNSKTPTLNMNKSSLSPKPTMNEDLVLSTLTSVMNHSSKQNSNFN